MFLRALSVGLLAAATLAAQDANSAAPAPAAGAPAEKAFLVDIGTRVPLSMINSVSTKHSSPGDRVYLETTFPIIVDGRIVIPAGSYVMGTITDTHRPGKVKGRGEFRLRFDSLTLPNGVTRDFRASVSALDGRASDDLDKKEGTVRSEGNKSGDAINVGIAASSGASGGALIGLAAGRPGMGAGIGAAAGAAAGLIGVLATRGPDAVLAKGTTVEMVLDRQLTYASGELDFSTAPPARSTNDGSAPLPSRKTQGTQGSQRRFPL